MAHPRVTLEKLAANPKSMLSKTPGIFSLIKAQDYDLFECLCSEKLDRDHPECDVRRMIDTEFAKQIKQTLSHDTPVHVLDMGAGMLFSSAVRVAELIRLGYKKVHIYLTDPLYDDNLQKRILENINEKRTQMADAAKKAFSEFVRLMKDCGIESIEGDEQGKASHILSELKLDKSEKINSTNLFIHIYGDIDQISADVMHRMNAVLIIDIFPPTTLHNLLGTHKNHLKKDAVIFSCKEPYIASDKMIASLSKDDIQLCLPQSDAKLVTEIKNKWDHIVKALYPDNAKGNFDAFYSALFNKDLPKETSLVFNDVLKRISTKILEVRKTKGSALAHFDWDDTVDIVGYENLNYLQEKTQPIPIYSLNPFPFWNDKSTSDITTHHDRFTYVKTQALI
jgi:hypothetical protein